MFVCGTGDCQTWLIRTSVAAAEPGSRQEEGGDTGVIRALSITPTHMTAASSSLTQLNKEASSYPTLFVTRAILSVIMTRLGVAKVALECCSIV